MSAIPRPVSSISLDEALASRQDLWGIEAMRRPNGPSYEFFAPLLPPLRYVNAAFHHYPIVLSAPGGFEKARLVSNGSAINARANLKTWKDAGIPMAFFVGETNEPFGDNPKRVSGPTYERGYLPIVHLKYEHAGCLYEQETFASTDPPFAVRGMVFTRFTANGTSAVIRAQVGVHTALSERHGAARDTNGNVIVWFSKNWHLDPTNRTLTARLDWGNSPLLAVPGARMDLPILDSATKKQTKEQDAPLSLAFYEDQRKRCVNTWEALLTQGTQFQIPEQVVNDAWRSLIVGSYMVLSSSGLMHYSHGNAYERLYQAECGDATRALLLFGHTNVAANAIPPLLHYTRVEISPQYCSRGKRPDSFSRPSTTLFISSVHSGRIFDRKFVSRVSQ